MKIVRILALLAVLAAVSVGVFRTTTSSASTALAAPPDKRIAKAPSDLERATELLETYKHTYLYLDDVTVSEGDTPDDAQAVSYYTVGQIVLNPNHSATTQAIIAHEIWHVIDYRDNGKLDWGESIPPVDSADYFRR